MFFVLGYEPPTTKNGGTNCLIPLFTELTRSAWLGGGQASQIVVGNGAQNPRSQVSGCISTARL